MHKHVVILQGLVKHFREGSVTNSFLLISTPPGGLWYIVVLNLFHQQLLFIIFSRNVIKNAEMVKCKAYWRNHVVSKYTSSSEQSTVWKRMFTVGFPIISDLKYVVTYMYFVGENKVEKCRQPVISKQMPV